MLFHKLFLDFFSERLRTNGSSAINKQHVFSIWNEPMYLLMELQKSSSVGLTLAILICLVFIENNVNNMPLLCFQRIAFNL